MQVTEMLARYCLSLQGFKKSEVGLEAIDMQWRELLEQAFPVLKEERENQEFEDWVWSRRSEEEDDVRLARSVLEIAEVNGRAQERLDELLAKYSDTKMVAYRKLMNDGATREEWKSAEGGM